MDTRGKQLLGCILGPSNQRSVDNDLSYMLVCDHFDRIAIPGKIFSGRVDMIKVITH
jgi:hypothetical protein